MKASSAVYLCRGDRKNTFVAFFVFIGIAALGFAALFLKLCSPIIAQTIAFIALIVAAYIFIRYIGTAYRYEVIKEEEHFFFLVIRVQGKKDFTQRKLPLSDLVAIMDVENNPAASRAHPPIPVTNYSSHLLADTYTLLHFEGEEPSLLRINADENFLSVLAAHLPTPADTLAPPQTEEE